MAKVNDLYWNVKDPVHKRRYWLSKNIFYLINRFYYYLVKIISAINIFKIKKNNKPYSHLTLFCGQLLNRCWGHTTELWVLIHSNCLLAHKPSTLNEKARILCPKNVSLYINKKRQNFVGFFQITPDMLLLITNSVKETYQKQSFDTDNKKKDIT